MKILQVVLTGIVIANMISCKETDITESFDITTYWQAHHEQSWDSTSTANQLIGRWIWIRTNCCGETQYPSSSNVAGDGIQVRFSASSIDLIDNGEVTQSTPWSVSLIDGDLYGLEMDQPIQQLYGRILFAGHEALFNHSYIDGADNYFLKELTSD